ncbi:hypothetical protein D9M71_418280 [compost metagenome]
MAKKIEIDPMVARPTFFQAKHRAIEVPGGGQVVDRNGQVKRGELHRANLVGGWAWVEFSPVLFD